MKKGQKIRKRGFLHQEDFFAKISERANYINTDLVKEIYYEMVRVSVYELRTKKTVKFPDLGEFHLHRHKERYTTDLRTQKRVLQPAHFVLKFIPDYKIKQYFHDFEGDEERVSSVKKPIL